MRIARTKAAEIARGVIERTFNVRVFRNDVRMFVTPGHFYSPIASPRPKPPSSRGRCRAGSARRSARAPRPARPAPRSADLDRRRRRRRCRPNLDHAIRWRHAQRVVEQDAQDPRDAAGVGLRPGVPSIWSSTTATSRSRARSVELGGHRARVSTSSTGSLRSSSSGIEAAEVEQVGGQAARGGCD